ncbi:peptidase M22, glycoprotease [Mycolicibacterium conceptionense]|uniref:Peptidase M22, glycoprotease n=1 Tax=Mycolicibacterium conceptionense TaxID=451644 RepID=A0A0U1D1A0_9MYCO|nr:peptidase M22, glycoprotease [Mycolicibacterium conceptionense]
MNILTIDTATPAVSAGVVRRGEGGAAQTLAERVTVDARAHAEQLTPNVLGAVSDAGITVGDLDAVVVGCGPGPFTGLRVGMASAAAFGHALDVPVHGVCSLDAIGIHTDGDVLVVTDARRREVYWAHYRDGVRVDGPAVNAPADVAAVLASSVAAVAGSPEHAALFALPGSTWCTRRPQAWCAPSRIGMNRNRWSRCTCAGLTPNPLQRYGNDRVRCADPGRCRAVRRA